MLIIYFFAVYTIDCFECHSIDGSTPDCEDEFGDISDKGHLLARNCQVGYLKFKAHFCIKIKGTKREYIF